MSFILLVPLSVVGVAPIGDLESVASPRAVSGVVDAPEWAPGRPFVEQDTVALAATDPDASCVMQEGVDIGTIAPLTTAEDVVAFYSYGVPVQASYNGSFPTISGDSMIFVHRDSTTGARSLVIVHDRSNDGTGGTVHMDLSGLGAAALVAVEDDPNEGLAAGLDGLGNASFDWQWLPCCTDGVAVADVDWDAGCVTVEGDFTAGIDTWSIVDGETTTRIALDPTVPLMICPGECNSCPTAVAGSAQTVECTGAGQASATLDGSGSSDPDDDALTYAWSIDGGAQTAAGEMATVDLARGGHDVSLEVSDGLCEDEDATTVTVVDSLAPSIACPADETLVLDAASCTASLAATATGADVCEGDLSATHTFAFAAPGTQTHTYTLADTSGNSASCDQTVDAVDLAPPVVDCPADQSVSLSADACQASLLGEAIGIDACGGAVSESHLFVFGAPGAQTWTYVLTDASGNTSTCTQTVTAVDVTPPVYVPGPPISLWAPNHKYVTSTLGGCGTASDACDGALDLDGGAAAIASLSSSEPDDVGAGGDGHTTDDALIVDSHTFAVRGERQGKGDGRAYSIGMDIHDASANVVSADCSVTVPHDQSDR